jgi:hypothetical protein
LFSGLGAAGDKVVIVEIGQSRQTRRAADRMMGERLGMKKTPPLFLDRVE